MVAKVINFNKFVVDATDGEYEAFERPQMLLKGEHGYVVTDYEFIHQVKPLITDSYKVYVNKKCEPGHFAVMPSATITAQLSEIMEETEVTEMNPQDFFRNPNYNMRLGANWRGLLESLKEIGYDATELIDALHERNQG